MIIGILKGGDAGKAGAFLTLRRLMLTLLQGNAAFNRLDLSPANDALLRCAELTRRFRAEFHSLQCRKISETDFTDTDSCREFFGQTGIEKCAALAEKTAVMAVELSR